MTNELDKLPEVGVLLNQMQELSIENQKYLLGALDPTSTVGVDEKLLKPLNLQYVEYNAINVFSILGIETLYDLVQYDSIEDLDRAYQKKTNATKPLRVGTKKSILSVLSANNVDFNMDTSQSHSDSLVFEKRKRLFFLSFDLNNLDNKKAMKEYGIENVGGLFIKLFETGIHNFSELLTKYPSADSILIPYVGKSSVARLNQYLYELDLEFGMDMSPYVGDDLS